MAREVIDDKLHVIVLSKKEIVNLVGMLTAQLGSVTLGGHMHGACPDVDIEENGNFRYRMSFVLEPSNVL